MTSTNKRDSQREKNDARRDAGGEVELLPLPPCDEQTASNYGIADDCYSADAMEAYARANVERALAESRAEVAALSQRPVVDELPPHIRSAAGFLAERLNHAPCDRQAVSDCVRCNALVLARHLMGITVPLRLAPQQPTGEEG